MRLLQQTIGFGGGIAGLFLSAQFCVLVLKAIQSGFVTVYWASAGWLLLSILAYVIAGTLLVRLPLRHALAAAVFGTGLVSGMTLLLLIGSGPWFITEFGSAAAATAAVLLLVAGGATAIANR